MFTRPEKRGQAVLEMALVLPVFIFVVIAIYDFAVTLHVWSSLNQAAIAGAREGSKRVMALYPVYRYKKDPDVVKNAMLANLSPMVKKEALVAGYNPMVSPVTNASGTAVKLHVVVKYNHQLITPFLNGLVGGSNSEGKIVLAAEVDEDLN